MLLLADIQHIVSILNAIRGLNVFIQEAFAKNILDTITQILFPFYRLIETSTLILDSKEM